VDPQTLGISPATARPCINENTALILAPHPMTRLCDIEGMEQLAQEYHLPLFFDSVEACAASYKGKMIGGFGDCEAFSMHPSKVFNTCEGSYITTNNTELATALRKIRSFGFAGRDNITMLGTNAKLNELHAAMGLATLSWIDKQVEENKAMHMAYQKELAGVEGFTVIPYDHDEKHNWKSCLIRLEDTWPVTRDLTLDLLNAENIHARPYYYPPQHLVTSRQVEINTSLPVTEKAMMNHLILPFGYSMSMDDTVIVADVIRSILSLQDTIKAHFAGVQ